MCGTRQPRAKAQIDSQNPLESDLPDGREPPLGIPVRPAAQQTPRGLPLSAPGFSVGAGLALQGRYHQWIPRPLRHCLPGPLRGATEDQFLPRSKAAISHGSILAAGTGGTRQHLPACILGNA